MNQPGDSNEELGRHRQRELRKQVSLLMPLSDWRALRAESARRHVPMTELCRQWLEPEMQRLHREQQDGTA